MVAVRNFYLFKIQIRFVVLVVVVVVVIIVTYRARLCCGHGRASCSSNFTHAIRSFGRIGEHTKNTHTKYS